jgi:hypothetical protein
MVELPAGSVHDWTGFDPPTLADPQDLPRRSVHWDWRRIAPFKHTLLQLSIEPKCVMHEVYRKYHPSIKTPMDTLSKGNGQDLERIPQETTIDFQEIIGGYSDGR